MASLDDSVALVMRGRRAIADIIPHCVVEEIHEDRLRITQHPVEEGATVSDHAFLEPKSVEMRVGWSDSTARASGQATIEYSALIALQAEREPFTVSTGKRIYSNMLVAGVTVTDDARTKNAVRAAVRLQEVRIVSVRTTSGASIADQASPEKTAQVADIGKLQVTPMNPSTERASGV